MRAQLFRVRVRVEVEWADDPHPHPDVIWSVGWSLVCATFTYSKVHSPTIQMAIFLVRCESGFEGSIAWRDKTRVGYVVKVDRLVRRTFERCSLDDYPSEEAHLRNGSCGVHSIEGG